MRIKVIIIQRRKKFPVKWVILVRPQFARSLSDTQCVTGTRDRPDLTLHSLTPQPPQLAMHYHNPPFLCNPHPTPSATIKKPGQPRPRQFSKNIKTINMSSIRQTIFFLQCITASSQNKLLSDFVTNEKVEDTNLPELAAVQDSPLFLLNQVFVLDEDNYVAPNLEEISKDFQRFQESLIITSDNDDEVMRLTSLTVQLPLFLTLLLILAVICLVYYRTSRSTSGPEIQDPEQQIVKVFTLTNDNPAFQGSRENVCDAKQNQPGNNQQDDDDVSNSKRQTVQLQVKVDNKEVNGVYPSLMTEMECNEVAERRLSTLI